MTDLSDREFREAEVILGGFQVGDRVRNRKFQGIRGKVIAVSHGGKLVYVMWDAFLPTERWCSEDLVPE